MTNRPTNGPRRKRATTTTITNTTSATANVTDDDDDDDYDYDDDGNLNRIFIIHLPFLIEKAVTDKGLNTSYCNM